MKVSEREVKKAQRIVAKWLITMTQVEVGEYLGISQSRISDLMRHGKLSRRTLANILK